MPGPGDTPAGLAERRLPEHPLLIIQASPAWRPIDLHSFWTYRELLYFLVWRDVKIRYKETVLGVAWALLQPFLAMLVLTALFGRLAKLPSDGAPYALFAYAGLLPWTFFANAVTAASNSLVGSANLLKKVYFPRVLIPAAAVGAALVDLAVGMAGVVLLMAYYRISPTPALVTLLPLVGLTALFAFAVGTGLSAVNVKYRDVRYALPFFIQLSMFVTPVIYPSTLLPKRWQAVLALNPLAGIIESFRDAILGRDQDLTALGIATLITVIVTAAALLYFRRTERFFADLV